jgi:hypothetical protein
MKRSDMEIVNAQLQMLLLFVERNGSCLGVNPIIAGHLNKAAQDISAAISNVNNAMNHDDYCHHYEEERQKKG